MSKVKTKCAGGICSFFMASITMKDRGERVTMHNYCNRTGMSLEQMAKKQMICPKRGIVVHYSRGLR